MTVDKMAAFPVLLLLLLGKAIVSARDIEAYSGQAETFSSDWTHGTTRRIRDLETDVLEMDGKVEVARSRVGVRLKSSGSNTTSQDSSPWLADGKAATIAPASFAGTKSVFRRPVVLKTYVPSVNPPSITGNSFDDRSSGFPYEPRNSFLKAVKGLYYRGFRHRTGLQHRSIVVLEQSRTRDGSESPAIGNAPRPSLLPTGPKYNVSSLPYLRVPYLTVRTENLDTDDRVSMYVSASFRQVMSCDWFLNGRSFEEYDSMQMLDIGSSMGRNGTFRKGVCRIQIGHLYKLPSLTGKYGFSCLVTLDSSKTTINYTVSPQLTDSCPPAHCHDRNAVCKTGRCVCGGAHPVKLRSLHTTCRAETSLENWCLYDEQCLHSTANSECVDQGRCACKRGYARSRDNQCTKKTGINARCDAETDCLPFNARCVLSHCSCNPNAIADNNRCIKAASWKEYLRHIHGAAAAAPGLSTELVLLPLALVTCADELFIRRP